MGHNHIDSLLNMIIPKTTSKERVEESENPDKTQTEGNDVGTGNQATRKSYADIVSGKARMR